MLKDGKPLQRKPIKSASKRLKLPRTRVLKPKTISRLMKDADSLFSIIVRNKGATDTELGRMNRCYTCGNVFEVKRLHAGHYVSRMFKATRWDFDNVRPQCYACNIYRKGDAVKFRANLIKEIGVERVEAVEAKRDEMMKLTEPFLLSLISTFQQSK